MDVGSAWYPSRVSELQVWCLRKRRVLMTTFNEKGASDVLNISAVFCQKIVVILSFLFFFCSNGKSHSITIVPPMVLSGNADFTNSFFKFLLVHK